MENCLDKTCKHENQFQSEKCPYISPHRATLYKMENIGKHWIPVDVWSLLASSTLSWSADGRLFNLLAKHRLPGDLDWLGNTGHILAILGHYWAVNATIYICHYMPLIFIHWISLISIVIPYRSDSFCIPHIPQLYLYKMENCLDKTCKHENQFQSEKCPYISPHRATLYKMENIGKHWIPVDVWSLLASSTLSWSAEGRLFNLLAKHRLPGDLDWLGNTGHILAILGQSMPLYICHYMPLYATHIHSLISIVIPYHSDSFCTPHIPQLSLYKMEN